MANFLGMFLAERLQLLLGVVQALRKAIGVFLQLSTLFLQLVECALQLIGASRDFGKLRCELRVRIGRQLQNFRSAFFQFGDLFGPLRTQLFGHTSALLACLGFKLLQLASRSFVLCLLGLELFTFMLELGHLLLMCRLSVVQLAAAPFQFHGFLCQFFALLLQLFALLLQYFALLLQYFACCCSASRSLASSCRCCSSSLACC